MILVSQQRMAFFLMPLAGGVVNKSTTYLEDELPGRNGSVVNWPMVIIVVP